MKRSTMVLIPLLLAGVVEASAQDRPTLSATYKVEYRIKDGSDTAAKNGRRYSMLVDTSGHGTFHVGDRLAVATGSGGQFSYFDVGVNIDTKLREVQPGKLLIDASIDLNLITMPRKTDGAATAAAVQPTVSQIRMAVNAMVSPGKPTVVASIDDPLSERKLDVEAVVTKVE